MTWVVGAATPFGYGTGISDIRVTFSNGGERDCLQKIYPVGRFIAAGFAGSVAIGFAMIDRLKELLFDSSESKAWDPVIVSQWWAEDARAVFEKSSEKEQELQSQIMLIGAHPSEHNGAPQWPRCHVYTFSSPIFEPVEAKPPALAAIGCGTDVQQCRDALNLIATDHDAWFNVLRGEQGTPGGMATLLAMNLTSLLQKTQPRGISSHLHYCWVYRGRIVIKTNNHQSIGRWSTFPTGVDSPDIPATELHGQQEQSDPSATNFAMPRIATSLNELNSLLRDQQISSTCALG
jgi:hypothetical protein